MLTEAEPLSTQAACAIGYAEIIDYLKDRLPLDKAIEKIKINTRRFAKGQRTWFKTFKHVNWLDIADNESSENILDRAMKIVENKAG